ncbi:zinc-dependent metalloprotease [Kineosporia sp. J2-2]|uniref:Zinc-dependent metalloprotease n=1 Tax=Kineosporia corallincola TaxID=2835133 RepID=A0ABS5T9F1_9ACTN|nr:zinc-dependent metalloprotease [Kineosporia corallincola]MBT0767697.1 zinc-dependent metalloprotease [Kineosporia corallincola]
MAADPQNAPAPEPVDTMINWDLAARTAARVGKSGPDVTTLEAQEIVGRLREAAVTAHPHVQAVTGLSTRPGEGVYVVDRPGWARANIAAFRELLAPVMADLRDKNEERGKPLPGTRQTALGARVTGAEIGALLGVLSSRVLGQYDAFASPGRLLLIAPTIVAVERDLEVVPEDFRLWVCLHEETHRVQFTASDWLAGHLLGEVRGLIGELMLEPGQVADRFGQALRGLPEVIRGDGDGRSVLDAVQTPQQREKLARITAIMSLLEGHADVIMDDVGPQVVPTVAQIRQRFSRRRAGRGAIDQILRRLLGLDAKAKQYADGARFVRGVVKEVGMDGFNAVWTSPETLPRPEEINDPKAWVHRVHA